MKKLLSLLSLTLGTIMVSNAESSIYLIDSYPYKPMDKITINGKVINTPERVPIGNYLQLTKYRKTITKVNVPDDGRVIITRDMTWADKPFHDEITLDLVDGDAYYIELISGMKNKIKVLKEKDGKKTLEKAQKDTKEWQINPDIIYED